MPALLTRIETGPTSSATLRGHGEAVVALGDVEREGRGLAACRLDLGRGLGGGLAIDVEHGDAGALAGIAHGDGAADAGAGAGDGGNVGLQEIGHEVASLNLIF